MLKDRFRKFLPVVVDLETGGFNSKKNAILVGECMLYPKHTNEES